MRIEHDELGPVTIGSSIEFARRQLVLPRERLPFVGLQVHKTYEFDLPVLPVIAAAEACAEKLARYRRTALARDLYDLNWFAGRYLDESLVRRLWVLKLWHDVVDDRRGTPSASADDVLRPRQARDFREMAIGSLTRPVDIPAWEARVRTRFAFLAALEDDERRWLECSHRHRDEVDAALAAMST